MTTRIDLDGNPYSTEGNLKEVHNSESDLSALLGVGVYIDLLDCKGNQVQIGDRLSFDPKEWGGHYEFTVKIKGGEILLPGAGPSDITEWCEIIKKYDA